VHPYQRRRTPITRSRLWSGENIEIGRLVGVARCGLIGEGNPEWRMVASPESTTMAERVPDALAGRICHQGSSPLLSLTGAVSLSRNGRCCSRRMAPVPRAPLRCSRGTRQRTTLDARINLAVRSCATLAARRAVLPSHHSPGDISFSTYR
jgi:hypothetical protein